MKRYASPPKPKTYKPSFVDPPRWVIVRREVSNCTWCLEHNPNGETLFWKSEQSAIATLENMANNSRNKREIRRLYKHELDEIGDENFALVDPKNTKEPKVAKKTTSSGCLVELFEDYETRKFAIASRASTEAEFITEVSQAMGTSTSPDWNVRLRELLPLVVDMCCKYRGYKAESVFERREFVAGDLEMPNGEKDAA